MEDYNKSYNNIFHIRYKGLRLVPSTAALRELARFRIKLEDCKHILENGYSPRKRKKNIEEKWIDKGNKIINVVVVKSVYHILNEEVYLIIHVGMFTKK